MEIRAIRCCTPYTHIPCYWEQEGVFILVPMQASLWLPHLSPNAFRVMNICTHATAHTVIINSINLPPVFVHSQG